MKYKLRDLPDSPVAKNLPCEAGYTGLIPSWQTKIAYATEQWSPCTATTELWATTKTRHSKINAFIVQLLRHVWLFATPWTATQQVSLSFNISWSLLKLMSFESAMPSNHLILCHPLLLLPSIFLSIRVFSNYSALHIRWPKYWSFSFSIHPSNEYSGLISFRIDWIDLAVQRTLKSLLHIRVFLLLVVTKEKLQWTKLNR